jgi:hypothetical protein
MTRVVFKGMTNILRAVIQGLEATFENNGAGGMASTFQLLEIAHTHYCLKDNTSRSDSSPLSERNTPLGGSHDSLTSIDPNLSVSMLSNVHVQQQSIGTVSSPTAGLVAHLGKTVTESIWISIIFKAITIIGHNRRTTR